MKKNILSIFLLLISLIGFGKTGFGLPNPGILLLPAGTPTLTGPTSVCLNSTGNVYTTDAGQTNYVWSISGGTITAGGNSTSNTATVTWTAAGSKSISVSYSGSTETTLPVTVNSLTASISISASANPVTAGTLVTYTATPTNGGTSPYYHWKVNGADAGTNSSTFSYTPVNGDAIYCLLTSNAPCVTADFTSNIITMIVNPASSLQVTMPTQTASPGQTVYVPVKLYGAGSSGTPITGANLHIVFDTANLTYVGLTNFYSSIPSSQWSYSYNTDPDCNSHTIAANWIEPNLNTVAVPDGTTLFEIQFTYNSGNNPLTFCIYEFTDANINLVTTTTSNGAINLLLVDPTLTGPTNVCLNSTGNVYTTESGKTSYSWTVSGGTITAGGNSTSNAANVTWTSAGSKSISVAYYGSTVKTLPVTVNALTAGISISASANPVTTGTLVTFTAVPTNGGNSPYYHWKVNGSDAGTNSSTFSYVPLSGDAVYCLITSNAPCVTADFTSNIITMTVNPAGSLLVTMPTQTGTPSQIINVPVKLYGASGSGAPISGANLHITYDTTKLTYMGLTNFYGSIPSNQWSYSDNFDPDCGMHAVAANWIEPNLQTVAVPDGTTLFEIQFSFITGDCPLTFCIKEFTDVNINLLTTNGTNGAVNQPVVPALTGPQSVCQGSAGNLYITDPGKTNYTWSIDGGTITSGGNGNSTATVTWDLTGARSISVSYSGSTTTTLPVAVNSGKVLTLKAFLEGLYIGSGMMNQAMDENGPHFGPGIADQVNVELHAEYSYPVIEFSGAFDLSTDGNIVINTIPCTLSGNYYITIKHRNSIETVSANAVSFSGSSISYNFTTGVTQAFADNLKDNGNGEFLIWTGDVNQDGLVDSGDLNPIDNASTAVTFGYVPEDINGDGIVDSSDMNYVDNNSTAIIIAWTP